MTEIPEFGSLSDQDYAALGFRCGLEIHQQLMTERKLFCRCPAGIYTQEYDAEILRHMRPTLSELGEYDGTALMEFKTRKEIIYRLNFETVCTYEMDDAPPFEINDLAVGITLEMGMLLNLKLIDELHIARKQYLDGSIPTGFQRTTIVGVDGWVPYSGRRVGIRQVALEEDSCREVSDEGHTRTYIGDRLGMPLIEMVTEPHMYTPRQAEEVGQLLRLVALSSGSIRRGIGSVRQDVNVSITGGTRVEIKGVPRLPRIPRLTHYEAFRQKSLLDIRDELISRKIRAEGWRVGRADVTDVLQRSQFKPLTKSVAKGGRVMAVSLPGFGGLLSRPTQPHTPFVQEFSDRVRVIACLQQRPNLICADLHAQSLEPGGWAKVQRALGAGSSDAMVLVWGAPADVETAAREIESRALEAMEGVPSETRQAFADGTNGFERILPGPNRMYPDTDLPPIAISRRRIERTTRTIPERPWDRIERLGKLGVGEELVRGLLLCGKAGAFDRVAERVPGLRASWVAYVLVCKLKEARRSGRPVEGLSDGFLVELLAAACERGWAKEAVYDLLGSALEKGRDLSGEELSAGAPEVLDEEQAAERVGELLEGTAFQVRKGGRPEAERRRAQAMGVVMGELRGRADGRTVGACVEQWFESETAESQKVT